MSKSSMAMFGHKELVDPFELRLEDLQPITIAHSLAQLNRYTGHALYPFSVAQHTVNLVDVVPHKLKRAATIHDWSEAFTNDLSTPMKRSVQQFVDVENKIQSRIFNLLEEPLENLQELVSYDRRICRDEMEALFPHFDEKWFSLKGFGLKIEPWTWDEAKFELLKTIRTYV